MSTAKWQNIAGSKKFFTLAQKYLRSYFPNIFRPIEGRGLNDLYQINDPKLIFQAVENRPKINLSPNQK